MITKFSATKNSQYLAPYTCSHVIEWTYLGLSKWVMVNSTPRRIHIPPTTTYAIPRNGFRPPMMVLVLMTIDLVPLYTSAGNPILIN